MRHFRPDPRNRDRPHSMSRFQLAIILALALLAIPSSLRAAPDKSVLKAIDRGTDFLLGQIEKK